MIGSKVKTTTELMSLRKGKGEGTGPIFPAGTLATVSLELPRQTDGAEWYALEVEDPTLYIPATPAMFELIESSS